MHSQVHKHVKKYFELHSVLLVPKQGSTPNLKCVSQTQPRNDQHYNNKHSRRATAVYRFLSRCSKIQP